jgi:hypothetical protein
VAALTIENGSDKIVIYGNLEISKDKRGLKSAIELKSLVDAIVNALHSENLPDVATETSGPTGTVKNPFD